MAVIKVVSSRAGIGTVLDYVTAEEKTMERLLSGLNCQPDTAKEEMQSTKELWGKTGGRTYKHFVQSFAPDEKIDPEQAHRIACRLAAERPEWKGFEVLIATHRDKDHIHTHFIVNSVSFENGYKLQQSKADLQNMKDASDQLCLKYGLHITEKGKTFDGQERAETTAFRKDTYQFLRQAEQGEVKSYVQEIARAVMECRKAAVSRESFCRKMQERGYEVDWQDNHKYITFIDVSRQKQGEKQCKVRNNKLEKYYNIDFGKETLEREFNDQLKKSIAGAIIKAAVNDYEKRQKTELNDLMTRLRRGMPKQSKKYVLDIVLEMLKNKEEASEMERSMIKAIRTRIKNKLAPQQDAR